MSTVKLKSGRKIEVIPTVEQKSAISNSDAVMDARAVQAVKSAVKKAEFCKKPVAKYDKVAQKAYVQYADGVRKYVD